PARRQGYRTRVEAVGRSSGDARAVAPIVDFNNMPLRTSRGWALGVGSGYLFEGIAVPDAAGRPCFADSATERAFTLLVMQLWLEVLHGDSLLSGSVVAHERGCRRSWTHDDRELDLNLPTTEGGVFGLRGGGNTGDTTKSAFVARYNVALLEAATGRADTLDATARDLRAAMAREASDLDAPHWARGVDRLDEGIRRARAELAANASSRTGPGISPRRVSGRLDEEETMGTEPPAIVVLTTGGTIAGRLGASMQGGSELVGGIVQTASLEVDEVCRVPSCRITEAHWRELARRMRRHLANRPDLAGIVVTHGTDTLEETAFFLDLLHDDPRPVVLVGAMRQAGEAQPDGPGNLTDATTLVAHPDARERGVLAVLGGRVYEARHLHKVHGSRLDAFVGWGAGPVGAVEDGQVDFHRAKPDRVVVPVEVGALPTVAMVVDHPGLAERWLDAVVALDAAGVVMVSYAEGRTTETADAGLQEAHRQGLPVVLAPRVESAAPGHERDSGWFVTSLPAAQARIGLAVAIASGRPPFALLS
ncbi:MAG: asparaginase, partial [Myxococcota bacterium]